MKNSTLVVKDGIPQQRVDGCVVDPAAFPGCILLPITENNELLLPSGTLLPADIRPWHRLDLAAGAWTDIRRTPEGMAAKWQDVRRQRDAMIQASDWTQLTDAPTATEAGWRSYRQALRDITLQADPYAITWPAPPVA